MSHKISRLPKGIINVFVAAISLLCFTSAHASGNRHLSLNSEAVEHYQQRSVSNLNPNVRYLGSTAQWHLFAITMSSANGSMPSDKTVGYKIPRTELALGNGWLLTPNQQETSVRVSDCPRFSLHKPTSGDLSIYITHSKKRCKQE